jgi:tyrosinase
MRREGLSRRHFLYATAVGGLAVPEAAACLFRRRRQVCVSTVSVAPPPPALRCRQNVAALNGYQLAALRRGVAVMKDRPASDRRSWAFQANIHGTSGPDMDPLFNQCEHGTLFFLAWHRAYLYFFERILRQAAGDPYLSLPYWDWTTAPALPAAFRMPADPGNPLFDGSRFINDGSLLPSPVVVDDLNTALNFVEFPASGFLGFSPSLEGSPHGAVHVLIGGNMGFVSRAANDPIFWLHHCNIDRVWNRWLNRGGGRVNPSDSAFLDKTYQFADESGQVVSVKVRDALSSARLGYCYDNVPNPPAVPVRLALAARKDGEAIPAPRQLVASSVKVERDKEPAALEAVESKPLGLKPETVKLEIVADRAATLKAAADAAPTGRGGKIVLDLQGLAVADVPNFTYAIYLNLPEGAAADVARLHYVGALNFFGKGPSAAHDHAAKTFSETFDVTPVVARLRRAGRWDPEALSVTLRPLTVNPPKGGEEALKQRTEESAAKAKISYKRINLSVSP